MRGRRLRGFGDALCDDGAAGGLPVLCASISSVACGIHSSERSSSQGWVVFAIGMCAQVAEVRCLWWEHCCLQRRNRRRARESCYGLARSPSMVRGRAINASSKWLKPLYPCELQASVLLNDIAYRSFSSVSPATATNHQEVRAQV